MQTTSTKRILFVSVALLLTLPQTGCLKTRAQLREDGGEEGSSRSLPAKAGSPQEVAPHGQYVIDEIKGELTRLSGRVEDMERKTSANGPGANRDEVQKLEKRVAELEQAQASMIETLKKVQEAPSPSADPGELIEKGKTQMEGGNFEGAVETFSVAIKGAKGKKLEEAVLLRAESHYAMKDYKKAIVDYSKFPEKFTKSPHMPKALYQIGRSFEALGMRDDALLPGAGGEIPEIPGSQEGPTES
jgi:TolA-binding protein